VIDVDLDGFSCANTFRRTIAATLGERVLGDYQKAYKDDSEATFFGNLRATRVKNLVALCHDPIQKQNGFWFTA
jgi:hypothetical protein